ncbi:MAG: cob(I)yrinic acid a,c-diamide adenosyltransferase, partial [Actinobacteria bacterium]|nr:cob(I)yrinic acid a,c-diamide adenosyltransferase [Actinomycetota bacterium]
MTSVPPKEGPKIKKRLASESLVIVNTGDGKGKSSSAFGVVVRAVAREWPVGVVQFLKSGKW